ncbi:amidohydrolase [Marinobacterium mangrovicola]|uniref:Amidohydrolase 3 domain-containing protein n=1 Tax=Marinobacterium mangrovicola TaxID=1476959 RepID=A0A4R1G6Z9_9GAMM|nr:amidohydrolase [Marinobacterium mangrovicola]TCK03554.1 hypothetical protein CLV83_3825 [Marinobacterium mangrovicola]
MSNTRIFSARSVITMNPSQPEATHVAVRDGRILGVGSLESLASFAPYTLDERYADATLLPGFVEGHAHALEGAMWEYVYLGYFERKDPEGQIWSGVTSFAAMQERLREQAAQLPADQPLIAWGLDPIYFDGARLTREVIDAAVSDRPVVVIHSNLHVISVNSATVEAADLDRHAGVEGIVLDENGKPTGELQELAAMHAVISALELSFDLLKGNDARALRRFANAAANVGITTTTDLINPLNEASMDHLQAATGSDEFPVRLVPALASMAYTPEAGIERMHSVQDKSHNKLAFGPVKMVTDGSIQGYTARLKWPYYHDGHPNGMWNAPPEAMVEMIHSYHQAGMQLHIHTNGDEAVELALDALEEALSLWPRADHRHTLQHCQIIDHAQLKRAAKLGVCLNMFANHLYYWGDIHRDRTIGPERALRLEPLASARALNITTTVHCDAPVTPLGPLFAAWCAVNRETSSGAQLGDREKVSVETALRMITLDAAYTLKLDHMIGSLEIGKQADMVALAENPLEVDPHALRDIQVLGTVLGGVVYDAR